MKKNAETPKMTEWFFDKNGLIRLFLYEDRFISRQGRNLGWLAGGGIYSLTGIQIGWAEYGVLYDENNDLLAISTNGAGYRPARPGINGAPQIPEIPASPVRPHLSGKLQRLGHGGWSCKTVEEYFGTRLDAEKPCCEMALRLEM